MRSLADLAAAPRDELDSYFDSLGLTPERRHYFRTLIKDTDPRVRATIMRILAGDVDPKIVDKAIYREREPPLDEFLFSKKYLKLPKDAVFPRVLDVLREADKPEVRKVNLCIGKGSGKSTCSSVLLSRAAFRLIKVIRNPSSYFRLMPDDLVGLVNMAPTAKQANSVIFNKLWKLFARSACFKSKGGKPLYKAQKTLIEMPNNVHILSGHSNFKAYFGYNIYCGIVDEWSWFDTDDFGEEVYQGIESAAKTRFREYYKLIGISTPKSKDDPLFKRVAHGLLNGRAIKISADETDAVIEAA